MTQRTEEVHIAQTKQQNQHQRRQPRGRRVAAKRVVQRTSACARLLDEPVAARGRAREREHHLVVQNSGGSRCQRVRVRATDIVVVVVSCLVPYAFLLFVSLSAHVVKIRELSVISQPVVYS